MTPMFVIPAFAGMTTIYAAIMNDDFLKTLKPLTCHFDGKEKA
jgi:hypothetical protein